MKTKIISFVLLAVLFCSCLVACNSSEKDDSDPTKTSTETNKTEVVNMPEDAYDELLLDMYNYIANFESNKDVPEGKMGIFEVINTLEDKSTGLMSIGYVTEDLNKDGVEELIVVKANDSDVTPPQGTSVLALYTYTKSGVQLVFEGNSQSRYYVLLDNSIFNEVSGSADFAFGNYLLEENTAKLKTIGYYFAVPQSSNNEKLGFYYNDTGVRDVNASQVFDGDAELFSQVQKDYSIGIKTMSLMTFEGFELMQER